MDRTKKQLPVKNKRKRLTTSKHIFALIGGSIQFGGHFHANDKCDIGKSQSFQSKRIRGIVLRKRSFELEHNVTNVEIRRKYGISTLGGYCNTIRLERYTVGRTQCQYHI